MDGTSVFTGIENPQVHVGFVISGSMVIYIVLTIHINQLMAFNIYKMAGTSSTVRGFQTHNNARGKPLQGPQPLCYLGWP